MGIFDWMIAGIRVAYIQIQITKVHAMSEKTGNRMGLDDIGGISKDQKWVGAVEHTDWRFVETCDHPWAYDPAQFERPRKRALMRPRSVTPPPLRSGLVTVLALVAMCGPSQGATQFSSGQSSFGQTSLGQTSSAQGYQQLLELFEQWRAFERPEMLNGAPDYTAAAMAKKHKGLRSLQAKLEAIDPVGWPVDQQVDHALVKAEMNGMDFNIRVLRSWARDPGFYRSIWTAQSDTPAHEGPEHHASVELWQYSFPLSAEAQQKLARELETVPPLLKQARTNLVGNAAELWEGGIGDLRTQQSDLSSLRSQIGASAPELELAIDSALTATEAFVGWLEEQAPKKSGPSGIGRDNYTWYLKNVHLRAFSWEQEEALLRRELARAHSSLRLEEHRNRNLPELVAIADVAEYEQRAKAAVKKYIGFLGDNEVLEIRDYMEPALMAQIGQFTPEENRNFFSTAIHFEPMTLWTHFYHWWDLARIEQDPHASPIRRGPLLYNIFDGRAEGLSTAVEEMMMHAGLYDDNPRAREVQWILLAQRAARGLGSLYVHSGDMTMKEARDFHVRWTPRGWMNPELDLLGFEQLLYLRQPGYGTSYITGKVEIEQLMTEMSEQLDDEFSLSHFFGQVDAAGVIPVSLLRWQLTGRGDKE